MHISIKNSSSIQSAFEHDSIGIRSGSDGIRSGSDEILLGFKRDSFRIRARPIQARTEFEHDLIQMKVKLNQGPCAIQAGCDWSLSKTQTWLDRNSNEDRSEFELCSCRIRVALRKISKGFKRVLDKVWARFSP